MDIDVKEDIMNTTIEPAKAVSPAMVPSFVFGKEIEKTKEAVSTEARQEKKTEDDVQKAVKELNQHLRATNTEMNFSIDKETEKLVLKIVDSKTHEVIRQIPAEDALRRSLRIGKLLGFLVDENA
jgi:flagellar protein FlaG